MCTSRNKEINQSEFSVGFNEIQVSIVDRTERNNGRHL